MEEEQGNFTQEEVKPYSNLKKQFTTVTPLSKYLAMALFVILPLVTLQVGYNIGKDSNNSSILNETPIVLEIDKTEKSEASEKETTTDTVPIDEKSETDDSFVITILSPKENDEFCVGDIIPVTFTAPKEISVVNLGYSGLGNSEKNLGQFRTVRDVEGDIVETTIHWDQLDIIDIQVVASFTAVLHIGGRHKDDQNRYTKSSSELFAIIDCNQ